MLGILENISPSELVSNGYISNHNKVRRPRPKFKVSFYFYFCCFLINITQINFENINRKIQRIISDSCFQLKSRLNVDARAPSIPLLNFPFKGLCALRSRCIYMVGFFFAPPLDLKTLDPPWNWLKFATSDVHLFVSNYCVMNNWTAEIRWKVNWESIERRRESKVRAFSFQLGQLI